MVPSLSKVNFDGIYGSVQRGANGFANSGSIQYSISNSLTLLKQTLVYREDIIGNMLGAYSVAQNVTNGTANWAKLDAIRYVTKARTTDCTGDATSIGSTTTASKALTKNRVFLSICKDAVASSFGAAWQALWGKGNDLNEITATEEGRSVLQEITNEATAAIGNDFSTVCWWGGHPIVATTITADPLSLATALKNAITATIGTHDGWLKEIDASSATNLNNTISSGDIFGYSYTGDAIQLMADVKSKAKPKFANAMSSLKAKYQYPIAYMTPGIFYRLREQIIAANPGIASTLCWQMNGTVAAEMGIEIQSHTTYDVFLHDGVLCVLRQDWEGFAAEVGFYHHRVLMFVPQVALGVALDVEESSAFEGMGLTITKSPAPNDHGKTFLEANYQMAAAVLDADYLVNYRYYAAQS